MRPFICLLTVALLFPALVAASDDRAPARKIVDKAIEAAGGKENLQKFTTMTWTEKGTYYGMGEGLPYTGKYAASFPHKFRMEIEGVFTLVLNGDKGWMSAMGAVQDMPEDQLKEHLANHYAGWVSSLLPLTDKESTDKKFVLKPLDDAKVKDKTANVVLVSCKGHQDVTLLFDKESGLLLKTQFKGPSAELGKEVLFETFYLDYETVEGAKIPAKLSMLRDDKKFVEAENHDMKPAKKLDEKLFQKPE